MHAFHGESCNDCTSCRSTERSQGPCRWAANGRTILVGSSACRVHAPASSSLPSALPGARLGSGSGKPELRVRECNGQRKKRQPCCIVLASAQQYKRRHHPLSVYNASSRHASGATSSRRMRHVLISEKEERELLGCPSQSLWVSSSVRRVWWQWHGERKSH